MQYRQDDLGLEFGCVLFSWHEYDLHFVRLLYHALLKYEKAHRISSLGCALSQTAMDEATEKLSQTYQDIRTEMLNIIDSGDAEYIFVLSKALFGCSLAGKSLSETKELLYPHVTEEN